MAGGSVGKSDPLGRTILGRYLLRRKLGSGSFGDVYEAEDQDTHGIIAAKFDTNRENPQLIHEHKIYRFLAGMDGIPNVYGLYDWGRSRVLIMDHLGPSLETLFRRCSRRFSLKTVLMIADQMLRVIEWVHSCGVLHRDIKPQNFLVGRGEQRNKIYLIDFGCSTTWIDPRTHLHEIYTRNNGLIGTCYYVSINTHLGDLQSRRDDLESILYVLVRFLIGRLPWQGAHIKDAKERGDRVTQTKIHTAPEMLCAGLPQEFRMILEGIRSLNFDEAPNYFWMRQTFMDLFIEQGFVYDGIFDWDDSAAIHPPWPEDYLAQVAARYQRENARAVRQPRMKDRIPKARQIFVCGDRV
jgi:casein kinase 1